VAHRVASKTTKIEESPGSAGPALSLARQTFRGRWTARFLSRSPLVHRLLRRLVWAEGALALLEEGRNSEAVRQMLWARALEQGSTLSLFLSDPEGMEPENFAEHMTTCHCAFWHWFLERGVESEIRTVLDVGCGTGYLTHHFVCRGFDVTGVTSNSLEKDECLRRGMKVLEEDFHFLSAPDAGFDLVVSTHSLEHSISPLFALWEWKRVLRPGGYMLITLPMPLEQDARAAYSQHYDAARDTLHFEDGSGEWALMAEKTGFSASSYGGPLHPFVLSYWQLRWLFRLAGLELVADGAEEPLHQEPRGVEYVDGRIPYDPQSALNGFFLLRNPVRAAR